MFHISENESSHQKIATRIELESSHHKPASLLCNSRFSSPGIKWILSFRDSFDGIFIRHHRYAGVRQRASNAFADSVLGEVDCSSKLSKVNGVLCYGSGFLWCKSSMSVLYFVYIV